MSSNEPRIPDPTDAFRRDFAAAERRVAGEIDPGKGAVFAAVLVLALLLSFTLPHAGTANGWDVLVSSEAANDESIKITSQLFGWFAAVFGVGFAVLALVTRRWVFSLIAAGGCFVGSFLGVLAIWSRQTLAPLEAGGGPGAGLVVGLIAMILLFLTWLTIALSHSPIPDNRLR
ncbi:Rv2732c family membrane protein [Hoyosella subflava]|uniref:Transmembrane protein n=1 Tax=Hoyosella subflava (strain DSM 45089 / JCM 17490 / NBRC 109087 / DQS3-9A1) TaxID=443218 RepID=F6EKM4_HOYSD|nr:hypothetical protein [Hoyosella subflava]AEF40160.1 hypothetical protein AS9A_1711 [Hoyosella subflava DQS3-9A1]